MLHYDCSCIEDVHLLFYVLLIIFLRVLNLDVIKSTPLLECNAGSEQSLVLFYVFMIHMKYQVESYVCHFNPTQIKPNIFQNHIRSL